MTLYWNVAWAYILPSLCILYSKRDESQGVSEDLLKGCMIKKIRGMVMKNTLDGINDKFTTKYYFGLDQVSQFFLSANITSLIIYLIFNK